MYDRRLAGEVLEFGHAGMLYHNSFVLYDKRTESLWVHVTGEARTGPLKGRRLDFYPSLVASWKEWKEAHPGTLVLTGQGRDGFMGTYQGTGESGRRGFGLSVQVLANAKLYRFSDLARLGIVNDVFQDTRLAVVFDGTRNTAAAFEGTVDGKVAEFELAGKDEGGYPILRDRATGSTWNGFTGRKLSGAARSDRLAPVPSTPILLERWRAFYPEGVVFEP